MGIDLAAAGAAAKQAKEHLPLLLRAVRWVKSRIYPKAPRKTLGLAIAITTEDDKQREQIKSDFIQTFNDLIESSTLRIPFSLVLIPELLAEKIKSDSDAFKALNKTGCVFMIWGKARNRKFGGEDNYVLDLRSAVVHDFIPEEISKRLAREMEELLPRRRQIARKDELIEFELNAASMELSVRYVLGVAAHLSDQDDFSIEIFEDLQQRLGRIRLSDYPTPVRESLKLLRERVPIQLRQLHLHKASQFQLKWRATRDINYLERMMEQLSLAEKYTPDLYQARVLRALYYFAKDRNIKRARKEIAKFKKERVNDGTWAFDEAFLLAYQGQMASVPRYYRMAMKKLNTSSPVIVEVEEFILWVLSEEPDKKQLHFCLGLVNYWGKEDFDKAREDFNRFLSETEEGGFEDQRELAIKFLGEMGNKAA